MLDLASDKAKHLLYKPLKFWKKSATAMNLAAQSQP